MFSLAMPLCIFILPCVFFFAADSALTLLLVSTTRPICSCVRSVMEYVFSVLLLVLGIVTSFILVILFSFRLEERKATDLIHRHLEEIDPWDEANAQLLTEIRAAEAIIQKKLRGWEIVPERNPRSKTAGSTYFIHVSFSPRPLEAPEPSTWSIVRWWRQEDDPRVWAAKAKLTHQNGVLSDKRAVLARLKSENEDLSIKREEATRKRDAVQWRPCQLKPTQDRWTQNHLGLVNHPRAACQPAPTQGPTSFFRRDMDFTNERIHYCEFCTKGGHRWRLHYDSFANADAAPFVRPCPAAAARLRVRPSFVSAGRVGGPSFFAPDLVVAPEGLSYYVPAPAPLFAAPSFIPVLPASAPHFPPPPAAIAPTQAAAPLPSALPVQASVPKVSVPVTAPHPSPTQVGLAKYSAPPPSAPQAGPSKSSVPPSAAPVATSAAAGPAPIVKTAHTAPQGKGPPKALQIVWATPGPSSTVTASAPAQTNASLSHEQQVEAMVKEEAKARALEKNAASANKKMKMSAPQEEKKKNYRFG